MTYDSLAAGLKAAYSGKALDELLLSFEMYHPTRADMEPEIDYSSMENYERSRARRAEFHLYRYQWEERNR